MSYASKIIVFIIALLVVFGSVEWYLNKSRTVSKEVKQNKYIVSGTYSCPSCKKSYAWNITDNHLMYWDGKPYIPVGTADFDFERLPKEITEINLTIDADKLETMGEAQYLKEVDSKTNKYISAGKTYILIINYPFPKNNAQWLFDENEVAKMTSKWKEYAPLVRKDGLRAISLFNEINTEWSWPDTNYTKEEYGIIMGKLAKQAQQIFGEVPIFYKTAATGGAFKNVYEGAFNANGIGFDFYANECQSSGFDTIHNNQLTTFKNYVSSSKKQLGLLWIAETGKRSGLPEEQLVGQPLEAGYSPYKSKEELLCFFDHLVEVGATGFVTGMGYVPSGNKKEVYKWYAEAKPYIQQSILQKAGEKK